MEHDSGREGGYGSQYNGRSGGGGFNRSSPQFSPVRVGEELDVAIEAVGGNGDGIAKKNGFVLFVPNVKQGDNVRIRVTKVFKKVGFAELVGEAAPKDESQQAETPPQQETPAQEEHYQDSEDF